MKKEKAIHPHIDSYVNDLQRYVTIYKSRLRGYKEHRCAGCAGNCAMCKIGKKVYNLECDIEYCEHELARVTRDREIQEKRRMYRGTNVLCITNIKNGIGEIRSNGQQISNGIGVIWATKF